MIVWLTGIPAAGKTTLAGALVEALLARGRRVEWLDGDALRASRFADTVGFSEEERRAHVRRVAYLARRLEGHVDAVVVSLVSPYAEDRDADVLVHVDCPKYLAVKRDPKGLYGKAMRGEITGLTGYDAPYERPVNPDVYLDTETMDVGECVAEILKCL